MTTKLDKDIMIGSYRNISFYGEKRGAEEFEHYTALLDADLVALKDKNATNYESKFIDKVMAFFHSQSNCASAFICGPANFNNRRNEKRWDWRDKKLEHFEKWREGYFRAVNRVRTLSPEAEIDVAIARLEYLETEKAKTGKYTHEYLRNVEETPDDICKVYNVTTKIRETKKKIQAMKNRIEAKNSFKDINFKGGSITIENDRVVIRHEEKPERDIIQAIKSRGFRWSPKMMCWCRKHTRNALYDAELLLDSALGGAV